MRLVVLLSTIVCVKKETRDHAQQGNHLRINARKKKKKERKNKERKGAITSVDPVDGAMSLITATKQGI